ncbi:MAG: class III extradiol ring-cleavage dioxygenase, partial [Asticcacaulis sp.]
YIPHGGGPCFFMTWNPAGMWDEMGAYLKRISSDVAVKPKAILIISAHWEEADFTIQTKQKPGMLFDYYGFPAHTYELDYPADGSPELAARVQDLAAQAGITVVGDSNRNYDHGVFIPMLLAYPDADIPTVQVSLKAGLDPAEHLAFGKALAPLRDEGVLIIGSGLSYHSLPGLMQRGVHDAGTASREFDTWMQATLQSEPQGLLDWQTAPSARACHPREEHLLPLMVVAGAGAGDSFSVPYHQTDLGPTDITVSAFQFG